MRSKIFGAMCMAVTCEAFAITPERVFDASFEATPPVRDCGQGALTPAQFAALAGQAPNANTGFCIPPFEIGPPVSAVICAGSTGGCTGCFIETDRTTATLTSAPDAESIGIVDALAGGVEVDFGMGGSCDFAFTAAGLGLAIYDAQRLGLDGKRLGPRSEVQGAVVDFQSAGFCATNYGALFRGLLDSAYIAHLADTTPSGGDVCPAN
jgi:hypothetical protein